MMLAVLLLLALPTGRSFSSSSLSIVCMPAPAVSHCDGGGTSVRLCGGDDDKDDELNAEKDECEKSSSSAEPDDLGGYGYCSRCREHHDWHLGGKERLECTPPPEVLKFDSYQMDKGYRDALLALNPCLTQKRSSGRFWATILISRHNKNDCQRRSVTQLTLSQLTQKTPRTAVTRRQIP